MDNLCFAGDSNSLSLREKQEMTNLHQKQYTKHAIVEEKKEEQSASRAKQQQQQQHGTRQTIQPLSRLVDDNSKPIHSHQQQIQKNEVLITPEMNVWPPPESISPSTQIEMNIWPPPPLTSAHPPQHTITIADKPHAKEEEPVGHIESQKFNKPDINDDLDTLIQNNIWSPPPPS